MFPLDDIHYSSTVQNNLLDNLFPGDRLLVCWPSSYELAQLIIESYKIGLTVVPVDPASSDEKIAFLAQHSNARRVIFSNGEVRNFIPRFQKKNDKTRFIMYTSGSTGNPKGVILSENAVKHNAISVAKIHHFEEGHATCLPLFHCNALMMSLMGSYYTKSPLLLFPKFNATEYFLEIKKHSIRTASMVPALIQELVNVKPPWPDCLEYIITAAAPLSSDLCEKFFNLYGPRLRQGYGMTEAVNFSFIMPKLDKNDFIEQYISHYPAVGHPLPDTEYRIVDGEVQIKGPNLMDGYLDNMEATHEVLSSTGWLKTGDIGEIRNGYLVLRGRKKEMINRGGESLYPVDLEQEWQKCGMMRPFSAVGIENAIFGEDIGLWTSKNNIDKVKEIGEKSRHIPGAVQFKSLITTSTYKPQRRKMGSYLFSYQDSQARYDKVFEYILPLLDEIVIKKPISVMDSWLYTKLQKILPYKKALNESNENYFDENIEDIILFLKNLYFHIKNNSINTFNLHSCNFRKKWPFSAYSDMINTFVDKNNYLPDSFIEIIPQASRKTLDDSKWKDRYHYLTLDNLGLLKDFSKKGSCIVVANHSLRYVNDKQSVLNYIYDGLNKQDILIIAEPNKVMHKTGMPWFLEIIFDLYDGMNHEYSLLDRFEWLNVIEQTEYKYFGYSVMRAKKYDLGGLIWAEK